MQMATKRSASGTKTFSVTLPAAVTKALEDWAESEGRNRGSLINYLLESLVRLKYPDRFDALPLPENTDPVDHQALIDFIGKLASGSVNAGDVAIAAYITGLNVDELQKRVDKAQNGNGNHATAQK